MQEIKFRLTWKEIATGRILQTFVTLDELLNQDKFTELTATKLMHNPDFGLIAKNQYLGKPDKNGKEIYEGDILKVYTFYCEEEQELNIGTIHEVKYMIHYDYPAFDLKPILSDDTNSLSYMILSSNIVNYKVIGNIHENPELLENK